MCSAQLPFVLPAAATTRAGSLGQALNERKQHVYNVAPRGTFSRARESFGQHPHDNLASMPWQPGTGFRPTALPRGGRDCIHWTTEVNGPTGRLRLCRGAEQSLRLYQRPQPTTAKTFTGREEAPNGRLAHFQTASARVDVRHGARVRAAARIPPLRRYPRAGHAKAHGSKSALQAQARR